MKDTPSKSSLSEARSKVSYEFFKEIFDNNFKRHKQHRKTYRGFYIYAVDGDDLNLPRSKSILQSGFKGHNCGEDLETHYPKMQTAFTYDILNGLIRNFSFSPTSIELKSAIDHAIDLEEKSIAIYDRMYGGYGVIAAHCKAGNHCLVRMKTGSTALLAVQSFLKSSALESNVDLQPTKSLDISPAFKVRLIKIKIPGTKEVLVFGTTLSKAIFSRKELAKLYLKRWDIETAFKELTCSLKMNQLHSKSINGILQEIYTLLWFVNSVKAQMINHQKETEDFLDYGWYRKSNFKLCAKLVIDNFSLVLRRMHKKLRDLLIFWLNRTSERRQRQSRSYQRVVKGKQSKFPVHSTTKRTVLTERH